ncbi:integrase [Marinobacterium zhoushanense]|uniref:Integrase n=1 Tax=Marinobacterium zhoushanense TaxID=1679163 RepID=A0ABQ1JY08_9GAMM|nr:site-specific integrase [Marinobacterium zhoushanense]GGB81905.1 integrase [Marinobacterium zhoushanense]
MADIKIPATNPDQFCKEIKASNKVQFFSDSKSPGLRLRVTTTGAKSWIYGYSVKVAPEPTAKKGDNYKNRSMSLGPFHTGKTAPSHALTVKQARDKAAELKVLVKTGHDPATENRRRIHDRIAADAARKTVREVFEQWHSEEASRRKDGGAEVRRMMEKDVLPALGSLGIDEVKKLHISAINSKVKKRGDRIAHVVFSLIRQLMSFAVDKDYIEFDPSSGIKKSKVGSSGNERDRILSEPELVELFQKLPTSGLVEVNQLAVLLQLVTCCRIGELLSAQWEQINFDQCEWLIPDTKNGKPHTVHLSSFATECLEKLYPISGHTPWLFPNRTESDHLDTKTITKQIRDRQREDSEPLTGRSVRQAKSLILLKGRGDRWTPHDLRRTGASLMAELGVMPDVIERCLNHTEENRIKRIYQRHEYRKEMRSAWDLLGERLSCII